MTRSESCKLSIIIPTYNRRELVLRAVDSILRQEEAGVIEIIVVDDGSTDGTAQTLEQLHAGDARVKVLRTQRKYTCAARNAGFRAASGDFICFLDSDDHWLPRSYAVIRGVFAQRPELIFLSIDGSTIAKQGHTVVDHIVAAGPGWAYLRNHMAHLRNETLSVKGNLSPLTLLRGDFLPTILLGDLFYLSGMIIRRAAVEAAGPFNERFRFYNDWEFFSRLCVQGESGYLDYDGFRRDSGRADQISRARPPVALARRQLFILHNLPRAFPAVAAKYATQLEQAANWAHYRMARTLQSTVHRRWSRRYLYRCVSKRTPLFHALIFLFASLVG